MFLLDVVRRDARRQRARQGRAGGRPRRHRRLGGTLGCELLENRLLLSVSAGFHEPAGDIVLQDDPAEFARFESDEALETYLIDDALERYQGMFGEPGYPWGWWRCCEFPVADFDGGLDAVNLDHSDTNVQVAGVDEGDIIETDGNYLYVLSGQEVVIVNSGLDDSGTLDTALDGQLPIVSRVEIAGSPFAQYLQGDRLTVLSRDYGYDYWYPGPILLPGPFVEIAPDWEGLVVGDVSEPAVATLSADMGRPVGPRHGPTLTVTVLDVSNREEPSVVDETILDGSVIDSRAIDTSAYLVMRDEFFLPAPLLLPVEDGNEEPDDLDDGGARDPWEDPWEWGEYVYETADEYLARIEGQVLDLALPHEYRRGEDGELVDQGLLIDAEDIYRPLGKEQQNLLSVVTFDMGPGDKEGDDVVPGILATTSIPIDYSSEMYMSRESLYLLETGWGENGSETSILKFDLDDSVGNVGLVATGMVPGRVLNQFSMDEDVNGYLRIATTGGNWRDSSNNLYVLQQETTELNVVGGVEELAPGEQIYSVRFMGDTAFMVTFRQTDPLFAIDLSNPAEPVVMGELHITGFSNYLHPVEDDFLLGIGREADPDSGRFQNLQISLFDVADLTHPRMMDRFDIDTRSRGNSEATSNHHAVGYFEQSDYKVLAIPVNDYGGWWAEGGGRSYFSNTEMWVFRIDPEADTSIGPVVENPNFELLGRIQHQSAMRRSVRVEDYLYAVSEHAVTVHDILDPENVLAKATVAAQELGWRNDVQLNDLDLSMGEQWYQFRPLDHGRLRFEASGDVAVKARLCDAEGRPLEKATNEDQWKVEAGKTYRFVVRANDPTHPNAMNGEATDSATGGSELATVVMTVTPSVEIAGRYVFYNNSVFDSDAGGGNDGAIAPDKTALLPGEQATFENYTSYSRGVNGIMIDVANLRDEPTVEDFEFRVGNHNDLSRWAAAPSPLDVTVRQGAGTSGTDRVTISWADGVIRNQWLQVNFLASERTGLEDDDVFYFGNAVGETGNSPHNAIVGIADELLARNSRSGMADSRHREAGRLQSRRSGQRSRSCDCPE